MIGDRITMFNLEKVLHFLNTFLFVGNFLVLLLTSTCTSYWIYVGYDTERVLARTRHVETARVVVPSDTDTYVILQVITCNESAPSSGSRVLPNMTVRRLPTQMPLHEKKPLRNRRRNVARHLLSDNDAASASGKASVEPRLQNSSKVAANGWKLYSKIKNSSCRGQARIQPGTGSKQNEAQSVQSKIPSGRYGTHQRPNDGGKKLKKSQQEMCDSSISLSGDNKDANAFRTETMILKHCHTVVAQQYIAYEKYSNLYRECDNLEGKRDCYSADDKLFKISRQQCFYFW